MNAGSAVVDVLIENVRVGGDDAEKVVERVGNDLGLVRSDSGAVRDVERKLHLRGLSKMTIGFVIRKTGKNRRVEGFGGERLEGQTTRSAYFLGFELEFGHLGGVESEDRESGVFGADFVDIVKALKVPSVNVKNHGVPEAAGQDKKELIEGMSPMDFESDLGGLYESLRDRSPGVILPEEQNLKCVVEH